MEEGEHEGHIGIAPRYSYNVNVIDADPNKCHFFISQNRFQRSFIKLEYFALKSLSDRGVHIAAIVSRYDNFALLV